MNYEKQKEIYKKSINETEFEDMELVTYVPFLFPKQMKLDDSPYGGTREDIGLKSEAYIFEDDINGIRRFFKARVIRYSSMDVQAVHNDLRVVCITYTHGFEVKDHTYLMTADHFYSLLNRTFV
jgi:hypothetical protein